MLIIAKVKDVIVLPNTKNGWILQICAFMRSIGVFNLNLFLELSVLTVSKFEVSNLETFLNVAYVYCNLKVITYS